MVTFKAIKAFAMQFENVRINSVKNAILFSAKSHFLAVKPKKKILDIEFVLDEPVEGFPVHKTVQASKYKWAHFVRLEDPQEFDGHLQDLIKRAYRLCS